MSSINELEKDLNSTRQELKSNMDALSNYATPCNMINRAKATTLDKIAQLSNKATNVIERAQTGDLEALKVLAVATGISIFGILLLLRKLFK